MTIDLDLLSEALPQQVAILGRDGLIVYANFAFRKCYQTQPEGVIGMRLEQVINAELFAEYGPFIESALVGDRGEIIHYFANRSDGRAWMTTFLPRPEGGCLIVSDNPGLFYTHPLRVDQVDERLQAFVNFAPIGMVFTHLDGRVLEANRAFLTLVGYSREELEQGEIHWNVLTPPEFLPLDYAAIAEAKQSGFSRTYEKEYFCKSGNRVSVLVGFILVGETRDEAVAFIVDMTAQKQAEAEVLRLNAELEERVSTRTVELEIANRELEAFCYSVSHDLRAPLRSIDGFAFALFQDYAESLDSDAIDFISRIRASAKRMDELVSALLALSRLTRIELDHENVDLSTLAEQAANDLRALHPTRDIELLIDPDLRIRADKRMLRVILDNLLDNAIKFTARSAHAEISLGKDIKTGAFYVRDNGVGFDMANTAKLFQPFERFHSPREFAGSGIGLATVHRIVRKHGGKIWAESEVDKGTTFYFTM